jgi:cob(I)alamin adenosyltransferase
MNRTSGVEMTEKKPADSKSPASAGHRDGDSPAPSKLQAESLIHGAFFTEEDAFDISQPQSVSGFGLATEHEKFISNLDSLDETLGQNLLLHQNNVKQTRAICEYIDKLQDSLTKINKELTTIHNEVVKQSIEFKKKLADQEKTIDSLREKLKEDVQGALNSGNKLVPSLALALIQVRRARKNLRKKKNSTSAQSVQEITIAQGELESAYKSYLSALDRDTRPETAPEDEESEEFDSKSSPDPSVPPGSVAFPQPQQAPPASAPPAPAAEVPPVSPEVLARHQVLHDAWSLSLAVKPAFSACHPSWQPAANEVRKLRTALQIFLKEQGKILENSGDEQKTLARIQGDAKSFTGQFIPILRRLDELISGRNERGDATPIPEGANKESVKQVRDLVLAFASKYGKWEEYPVKVGDTIKDHPQALYIINKPAQTKPDMTIREIVHPGYCQDNKKVPDRPPRVIV